MKINLKNVVLSNIGLILFLVLDWVPSSKYFNNGDITFMYFVGFTFTCFLFGKRRILL